MKLGKIALLALLAGLGGMELHAQSAPQQQTATPGAATSTPEQNSSPADKPKQPADEPAKPGQGATADQTPSPLPLANPPQAPENPQPAQPATESKSANQAQPPAAKSKKKSAKKGAPKPRRRVVRDGGTNEIDPQISEAMPNDVALHRRASTDTLLSSTEEALKRISNRRLTAEQQVTVGQIRSYMEQSRDAIKKSDVDRAHTLALKAHLLTNSLLKQ